MPRRSLIALVIGLSLVTLLPTSAFAATLAARASLAPMRQFIGDAAGSTFQLSVRNTGSGQRIGAFEIIRPSAYWSVLDCGATPAGWIAVVTVNSCRFMSAAGTADDIRPGHRQRVTMLAATAPGNTDLKGTWTVNVSGGDDFSQPSLVTQATPMEFGLITHAFSFQIMDAVLADGPAIVGDPCPAGDKAAEQGSTGLTVVLCGRNRTTTTQTLQPKFAGLKGTMIHSHGAFSGGPVAPTATSVVLGNWANVAISNAAGSDLAVMARVRSAPARTSPWRTLDGYESGGGNHAPVADNESYSTNEDQGFIIFAPGILNGDTDVDLDGLSVGTVNGSSANVGVAFLTANGGTVTVNADGSLGYTPAGDFNGSDSFTYTAFDGTSQSNTATVSIGVNATNDAPVADNDGYTTNEDQGFVIFAPGILNGDTDVDLDSLQVGTVNGSSANVGVATTTANGGTLTVSSDGSFIYMPAGDFNGSDSFTYTAFDGMSQSNTATVNITVNAVNDAPSAVGDSVATVTTTPISFAAPGVLDNDDDADVGHTLTSVLVVGPAHASSFNLSSNGSFSYTANGGFTGSDSFTYKANDGVADSNTVTVTITVNASGGGGTGGGGCLIAC